MFLYEIVGSADLDEASVLDYRDAIAESFRLFH